MIVVLIVVVLVLAVGGVVAFVVKSKGNAEAAEAAGVGPNEFLQAPPTSFPMSKAVVPAERPTATTPAAELDPDELDEADEDEPADEIAISRFRAPRARSSATAAPIKPKAAAKPVFHLEDLPSEATETVAESEPTLPDEVAVAEAAPESAAEPADRSLIDAFLATGDAVESETVAAPTLALVSSAEVVIDLDEVEAEADLDRAVAADEAWRNVVLEPQPDAVDHVLQALINRSRFKQVGVEQVATELVERADLRGEEVSDVLAELVGRADSTTLDEAKTSELTLFNDAVPSRPGQLTDFAKLAPADKKRIIIRVLCLLVARSEDQQLPPREDVDSAVTAKSWPLARAVWPLAVSGGGDGEAQLPNRRLAKSG